MVAPTLQQTQVSRGDYIYGTYIHIYRVLQSDTAASEGTWLIRPHYLPLSLSIMKASLICSGMLSLSLNTSKQHATDLQQTNMLNLLIWAPKSNKQSA